MNPDAQRLRSACHLRRIEVQILINGQTQDVSDHLTLSQLIDILGVPRQFVAAEVNCTLVPRNRHDQFQLSEGDCVEIVTLVGGG